MFFGNCKIAMLGFRVVKFAKSRNQGLGFEIDEFVGFTISKRRIGDDIFAKLGFRVQNGKFSELGFRV